MDATYRIQSNSATVTTAATSAAVTLPNPTTLGSTLVMFAAITGGTAISTTPSSFTPPWGADASQPTSARLWRRPNQPAGETSWTLNAPLAAKWAWRIDEWAPWSTVSQPDDMTNGTGGSYQFSINSAQQANNSLGTGGTGGFAPAPDISDFGALAYIHVQGGSGTFPLRSYSSGWSEVDYLAIGTGTGGSADVCIIVAESYPGVSGTCDCTMTWDTSNGGTYADKVVNICVGCYRPAPPLPAAVVVTA